MITIPIWEVGVWMGCIVVLLVTIAFQISTIRSLIKTINLLRKRLDSYY